MYKVFLGGTCAETTWRDDLIKILEEKNINYFNPVVKDWTPECQAIEEEEKNHICNVHLYVITPEMQGTYSIAEIIHSAHLANMYGTSVECIVFGVLKDDRWEKHQIKSFDAIMKLVSNIAPLNSYCGYVEDMNDLFNLVFQPVRND